MRAVVQRVASARVEAEGRETGRIGRGLVVLLGVAAGDGGADVEWLADRTARLRIFEDGEGRMNRSVAEVGGEVAAVSQFTLHADTRKGTRPSWHRAAKPAEAAPLYEAYVRRVAELLGRPLVTGVFGAMMRVELVNDGPVTLVLDSRAKDG